MEKIIVVREDIKSAHAYVHNTNHYAKTKEEYLKLSQALEEGFPGLTSPSIEFGVIQDSSRYSNMAIVAAKVEYREQWPNGWAVQDKLHDIYF